MTRLYTIEDFIDGSVLFFFFKQKTAYEMSASLVGSEMCIRDRTTRVSDAQTVQGNICNRTVIADCMQKNTI